MPDVAQAAHRSPEGRGGDAALDPPLLVTPPPPADQHERRKIAAPLAQEPVRVEKRADIFPRLDRAHAEDELGGKAVPAPRPFLLRLAARREAAVDPEMRHPDPPPGIAEEPLDLPRRELRVREHQARPLQGSGEVRVQEGGIPRLRALRHPQMGEVVDSRHRASVTERPGDEAGEVHQVHRPREEIRRRPVERLPQEAYPAGGNEAAADGPEVGRTEELDAAAGAAEGEADEIVVGCGGREMPREIPGVLAHARPLPARRLKVDGNSHGKALPRRVGRGYGARSISTSARLLVQYFVSQRSIMARTVTR